MTDRPAAIMGDYVDLKFMPGLKVARVFVDIPIEHSNRFLEMFKAPDRIDPVKVVIARMAAYATEEQPGTGAPESPRGDAASPAHQKPGPKDGDKSGRTSFRDMPRSQQAALKLRDPEFCKWFWAFMGREYLGEDVKPNTNDFLKEHLGIVSKKYLDVPGNHSPNRWDILLTEFDNRAYAR